MGVLCLFQFYGNPDTATNSKYYTFFEYLSDQYDITVIHSISEFNKPFGDTYSWTPPNVKAIGISSRYANRMGIIKRLGSFVRFACVGFWKGLRTRDIQIIWGVSTPLSVALIAYCIAKIKRVPWVFEVLDIWPDFPIQMGGIKNRTIQRLLYATEHFLYRNADFIITSSPDMETHARKFCLHDNVMTLYHGTDMRLLDTSIIKSKIEHINKQYQVEKHRVILYAGTLGRANDIPTALNAFAKIVKEFEDVSCFIIGQGYYQQLADTYAKNHRNIYHLPPEPNAEVMKWFQRADISLVTFIDKPVLAYNAPGKLMDSLACGTPVIVTNDGWTKKLIESEQCGLYAPASDVEALYLSIKTLLEDEPLRKKMALNAQKVAKALFDRRDIATQIAKIFDKIGSAKHS